MLTPVAVHLAGCDKEHTHHQLHALHSRALSPTRDGLYSERRTIYVKVVRLDGAEPAHLAASLACEVNETHLRPAHGPGSSQPRGKREGAYAWTPPPTPTAHRSPHMPTPTPVLAHTCTHVSAAPHTCSVTAAHADLPLLPGASLGWKVRLKFLKLLLCEQTKPPLTSSL